MANTRTNIKGIGKGLFIKTDSGANAHKEIMVIDNNSLLMLVIII